MKMELLQIEYFRSVAQHESISKAAQAFGVPPSSVSVAIKKLETSLGFVLFDRTANRLKLNAYGKTFLAAIESAAETLARAQVQMQNLSAAVAGEISMLILSNRSRVTECISAFTAQYPNVTFHIRHDGAEQYKAYDLIVSDRFLDENLYEKTLFCRETLCLAVPKNHPLAQRRAVSLRDLRDEKFICMPRGSSLGDCIHNAMQSVGIQPKVAIECDDPQYILRYLRMGMGVCLFPMHSWQGQADESIHLLRFEEDLRRETYVYVKRDALKAAKLFAEALKRENCMQDV